MIFQFCKNWYWKNEKLKKYILASFLSVDLATVIRLIGNSHANGFHSKDDKSKVLSKVDIFMGKNILITNELFLFRKPVLLLFNNA